MQNKVFVFVVFVPDPFLALYFKRLYDNWKDEVDGLLVQVNGYRPEVVDFIADLFKDEFVIKHYHHSNQGIGFDELYSHFKGDILGTMCSDNFIYRKGVITDEIAKLENYDAVGSGGLHIRPSIMADKVAEKIGTCRLNPFMSFWKAEKLKEIEPFTFQAVNIEKDNQILGVSFGEGRLDVMADMYIKFAEKGGKAFIHEADNPPYWMHASGLSSGVYGHLMHSDGRNLAGNNRNNEKCNINIEFLSWLYHCYETTVKDCPLKEFNNEYLEAIKRKAKLFNYDFEKIKEISNAKKVEFGLW